MTPAQQSALQGIVGRPLQADEIAAIEPHLDPDRRNDVVITEVLSRGRTRVVSHEIGIGTILAELAPSGGVFLDGLAALGAQNRNVYWSLKLIEAGKFDVGLPGTRVQMAALAEAMPELAPAFSVLLDLAEAPDPIPVDVVSRALNEAEGRMSL